MSYKMHEVKYIQVYRAGYTTTTTTTTTTTPNVGPAFARSGEIQH